MWQALALVLIRSAAATERERRHFSRYTRVGCQACQTSAQAESVGLAPPRIRGCN